MIVVHGNCLPYAGTTRIRFHGSISASPRTRPEQGGSVDAVFLAIEGAGNTSCGGSSYLTNHASSNYPCSSCSNRL